jgi:hypothetical protein
VLAAAPLALVAAVNMIGNIASGRLLQRGIAPHWLLVTGFSAMVLGACLAFCGASRRGGRRLPIGWRYAGVLLFSLFGGMVPGTLFSLAGAVAPDASCVSTTVGWMQQWSSFGQFALPPLVGWVAGRAGNWHWTWLVTGSCALAGIGLALALRCGVAPGAAPMSSTAATFDARMRVVADMQRWLERAVIGLNLCPFAKSVHVRGQVHWVVSPATQTPALEEELLRELEAWPPRTPTCATPPCWSCRIAWRISMNSTICCRCRTGCSSATALPENCRLPVSTRISSSRTRPPTTSATAPTGRLIRPCICCARPASRGPCRLSRMRR